VKADLAVAVGRLPCAKLRDDVRPFLERPEEAALLDLENLRSVLK